MSCCTAQCGINDLHANLIGTVGSWRLERDANPAHSVTISPNDAGIDDESRRLNAARGLALWRSSWSHGIPGSLARLCSVDVDGMEPRPPGTRWNKPFIAYLQTSPGCHHGTCDARDWMIQLANTQLLPVRRMGLQARDGCSLIAYPAVFTITIPGSSGSLTPRDTSTARNPSQFNDLPTPFVTLPL